MDERSRLHAHQLLAAGRTDDAAHLLRTQLANDPSDGEAHGLLAIALLTHSPRESRQHAEKYVATSPTNAHAHQTLAYAHYANRRFKRARTAAEQALHLAPNSAAAHHCVARVAAAPGAGWLESQAPYVRRAAHHARRAIELDPEDPGPYFTLAELALAQRRTRAAATLIDEGLALDPSHPRGTEMRARLHEHRGEHAAAADVRLARARTHVSAEADQRFAQTGFAVPYWVMPVGPMVLFSAWNNGLPLPYVLAGAAALAATPVVLARSRRRTFSAEARSMRRRRTSLGR